MSATTKTTEPIKVLQVGDRSYNHTVEWFMDSLLGPTGRMAQVTTEGLRYDDEGNAADDFDFYDATRSVTLFQPGGKRAATVPGLRQYEANAMADKWVQFGS